MNVIRRFTLYGRSSVWALVLVLAAVELAAAQDRPRSLHLVSVGITNAQGQSPLRATRKDALDMVEWARTQQGRLFQQVHVKPLTNEQATRNNIVAAVRGLRGRVKADDYVILYLSAHGGTNPRGEFEFCAYDGNLSWTDIRAALQGLPGNPIVIIDTCHAGAIRQSGNLIVFSSCLASQSSADGASANGNSLFTKYFLEALRGQGDINRNGLISISEIAAYVSGRLEVVSRHQSCTLYRPENIPDALPLSRVGGQTTQVATNERPTETVRTQRVPTAQTDIVRVAGTTWNGSEDFGRLRFDFRSNGEVVMYDDVTPTPVNGRYTQEGNRVLIRFSNCMYEGTLNGGTLAGRAAFNDGSRTWSFRLTK